MNDIYVKALESENEVLRSRVKELKRKLRDLTDSAVMWVDDNVGTLTAKALREHMEDLQ